MNKYLFPILTLFILFLSPTAPFLAAAQKNAATIEAPIPLPPDLREADTGGGDSRFAGEFFNMMTILALIVVFLYFGSWLFRRMMAQRTMQMNVSSKIKVLEQRTLSPKSALYIIEVSGKTLLISESLNGVKFLSELPENSDFVSN